MPPARDRVYEAASELLDIVVAGYVAEAVADPGWPPELDLPARQFVSIGPPAWDCPLIAVWVERVYGHSGDPTVEQSDAWVPSAPRTMRGWVARIQIVRCVPVPDNQGNPPTAAAEEAAAELMLQDCQVVDSVIRQAQNDDAYKVCHGLAFMEWISVGPEGGHAASTHAYRIDLTTLGVAGS